MSTVPTTSQRHALGLPSGSVRATHTLLIVGIFCALLLVPSQNILPIPPYLMYLLFMVLGHYFAHRSGGNPTSEHHPLYLPRGCIRFLVMAGMIATVSWCFYSDPEKLQQQFELSLDSLKKEPYLPVCILGSFFLGVIVRAVVGRDNPPIFLQDMEAWLSLVSTFGLGVAVIVHLVIGTTTLEILSNPLFETLLASVIAFYFGERS